MKNLWMKKMSGHTEVKITGSGAEHFINKLVREKIVIWNIRRVDPNTVLFEMFIKDIPYIRKAVRYHRVKVRFTRRAGFPYFIKRLNKNIGFIIGAAAAIFIVFVLSNMIWKVEIEGASPEVEYKLNNQLKQLGVRKGHLQLFVDDPETLQQKLTKMNDEITWIGVDLKGTTYRFQVVEKEQPEKPKAESPRNLVAKKEAVIVDYFVEKGEPVISINDFVRPGQLLVTGAIGREDNPNIVSAKGVVYGKTWYRTESEVLLQSRYSTLTGESITKHHIKLWNLTIPIWGFDKEEFSQEKVEQDVKKLKFLNWTIPVSYVKTTIREIETVNKSYTEDEARKMAKELAKKDLEAYLPEDAHIVGEKILHEQIDNGKLKLSIIYDVVENIAVEQPITLEN